MDNSGKQTNDFFAPMAQSPIGIVFLNDFVIVMNGVFITFIIYSNFCVM